jgi:hypothetical protein
MICQMLLCERVGRVILQSVEHGWTTSEISQLGARFTRLAVESRERSQSVDGQHVSTA